MEFLEKGVGGWNRGLIARPNSVRVYPTHRGAATEGKVFSDR
jgi:hypothetical protein